MTPPYVLRAEGPLMAGGCVGAGSGAGMRLSKVGVDGGDAPNSVVGLWAKPSRPRPCTTPPRAKPGVEATIQAPLRSPQKETSWLQLLCWACGLVFPFVPFTWK